MDEPQWVGEDVHGLKGVKLLVASRDGRDAQRQINRLVRSIGQDQRDEDGTLTEEAQESLDDMVLARSIHDWSGLTDGAKKLSFSVETAEALCQSSVFYAALRDSVAHVTKKANVLLEDLEKN
ncbi:hypothetical protein [Tateyamaria omphalii]|uniref:hypothetical protein n=1 Tax=Tateyamaria omphalii TaxID=299262 RepID=UPI001675DF4D|nr:hypothetical protein [Tateyamaria omphalii]